MAGNVLPPVRVTFTASITAALKNLAKLADTLERLGEAAKASTASFDVAMESMAKGAESLTAVADATKAARTSMSGLSRATNDMAAATDKAAAAADKGMTSIAEAATKMATVVDASTKSAAEGVTALGAEAAAAGKGLKVTAEESAASGAAMAETGAKADGLGAKWLGLGAITEKVSKWGALGLIGIGIESGRMASKFQAAMTQINTQAGVSQDQVKSLGNGVLNLAGQVGFSPDSLAEALFHVESSFASTGISGQKAMEILKTAAEGAKVGGANLVDVQNALDAAVASGIPGVQDFSQAMGALNAIVGSGDMKMQDLANALGTGVLAVVKGYGLSLKDVGAALATFGDNNIRGAVAATDLRMAVQALSVPAKSADADLKRFGMTNQTLADDMRKGGLKLALNDLMDRMRKAGVTADQQGQVITDMFGKKAGAGIAVLLGQIDRFNSKYPELDKSANGFANAWVTAKHTLAVQFDQIKAGFDSLMIKIGQQVIPATSKLITLLENKGAPVVKSFSDALSGIASGFTGKAGKAPAGPKLAGKAARLAEMDGGSGASAPPLTGWQKVGEALRKVAGNFKTFADDCVKAFHDIAQAAGPTLQMLGGALIGALQIVAGILAHVLGPALVQVSKFMDHHKTVIRDLIGVALVPLAIRLSALAVLKPIGAIAKLAADVVKFPFKQAKAIFDGIKSGIDAVTSAAGKVKDLFGKVPWDKLSGGAKSAAGGIAKAFSKTWGLISDGASKAASGVAKAFRAIPWGDIASGIGRGFSAAWSGIVKGAQGAAGLAVKAFQAVPWGSIGSGIVSVFSTAWSGIVTGAQTAMRGVSAAMSFLQANPVFLVITVIALLVLAFIYCWNHFKGFRDFFKGAWKVIVDAAQGAWKLLKGAFDAIVDAAGKVIDWIKGHWKLLLAIIGGPIGLVVALVITYWSDIKRWFKEGVNFVLSAASWLGRLPGMVWGFMESMANKIGQGTMAAIRWFEQLPGKILHAIGDLGSLLYNAGVSIIEGLWNGIVSMSNWLSNAITGLIKSVVPGPVLKILGINSPSKVFHEIGLNVMKGLAGGINAGGPQVAQASAGMANAVIYHGTPSALAVSAAGGAAAGGGWASQPIVVNIDGRKLFEILQTQALRNGRRNPTTGLTY